MRRRGFTMLEMLVVVAVIGLLIALLLPGVQAARELARRGQCANNLLQAGVALHHYHNAFGRFPARRGGTARQQRRISPWVALLPYLEQGPLAAAIRRPQAFPVGGAAGGGGLNDLGALLGGGLPPDASTPTKNFPAGGPVPWDANYRPWTRALPILQCPSDYHSGSSVGTGPSSYRFSIGDCVADDKDDAGKWTDARGLFGAGRGVALDEITDGASHTLALSERAICNEPTNVRQGVARNVPLDTPEACLKLRGPDGRYTTTQLQPDWVGRRWADGAAASAGFTTVLPPNAPSCQSGALDTDPVLVTPSSRHLGGVMALFADGSLRFVSEMIDAGDPTLPEVEEGPSPYGLWGALGSKAGREVYQGL